MSPKFLHKFWNFLQRAESPTTVIYQNPKNLASNVIAQDNSVAIRIVKDDFCQRLIAEFGKPIVSTSANISGESTPAHFGQIDPRIVNQMDFVVKYRQHDRQIASPSRLIRFSSEGKVEILR
ncbi:Putative ribosome maturation factor rimN (fragment) [Capnocytophaga canimorsus]|uniref:L-threonylcarbamoyladenylate synthase n=1 Tax=Capnocytophaga canimorsus TaxID=28188 RepID=A0A0B7IF60_9FLAO